MAEYGVGLCLGPVCRWTTWIHHGLFSGRGGLLQSKIGGCLDWMLHGVPFVGLPNLWFGIFGQSMAFEDLEARGVP